MRLVWTYLPVFGSMRNVLISKPASVSLIFFLNGGTVRVVFRIFPVGSKSLIIMSLLFSACLMAVICITSSLKTASGFGFFPPPGGTGSASYRTS